MQTKQKQLAPCSFCIRHLSIGPVYYCKIRQSDGSMSSGVNTNQTSKNGAINWAVDYLQKNGKSSIHGVSLFNTTTTMKEIAEDFFNWKGKWAVDKKIIGNR